MDDSKAKVVAQIQKAYLPYSEIFIYRFLTHFKHVLPVIIAQQVKNLELFPIEHLVNISIQRFTPKWMRHQVYKLFGYKNFFMEKALKECHAKLIHAHFGPRGVESLEVARKLHLPLITTFYGYDISVLIRDTRWKSAYQRLFNYGAAFLAEGSCIAQKILEAGCPSSKIKIQHLGVCPEIYRSLARTKENDKLIILFCGRFTEKKGIRYALEAFSRIAHKYPELEMKLVGSGEDEEKVLEKICELKIQEKVKPIGVLPFKELVKELRNADIFIHPSVTASDGDSEGGAPTILMEASAAGLPIISTRHADIPEVVLHGQTGFLAEERNVEQLTHSLEILINDPLLRKTMGDQGRQHIIENYNIENEAPKLEDFYLSILQLT